VTAGGTMLGLALLMSGVLGWASRRFHITEDPRLEQIEKVLPQANCGACGCVGCREFAEAVLKGEVPVEGCPVGGATVADAIAEILGVSVEARSPRWVIVHCGAECAKRLKRTPYYGERTCAAAHLVSGVQGCTYGCLGLGDCERACPFDAIDIINGLAVVDYHKCTGCGKCIAACPRKIIELVSFTADPLMIVACANRDPGREVRAVCRVGCIACGICRKTAPDIFKVTDNLSVIDYRNHPSDDRSRLELAARKCPTKCLVYRGRKAGTAVSRAGALQGEAEQPPA
ncbi:MAG TPA: RnfABCDGE type electron transport complex subunit B, partial [Kiritimatiellae bacterium]|nr:RnfABCDGE type electron transport complex subunit B [Kiritimatiellia bacterium]